MKVRNHKAKNKPAICLQYTSISSVLAEQIESIISRRPNNYINDNRQYFKPLLNSLPEIISKLSENDCIKFLRNGFEAFSDLGYRLRFEHAYYHVFVAENTTIGNKNPLLLIRAVIGLHFDDEINYPLSEIEFEPNSTMGIYRIYSLPIKVIPEARLITLKIAEWIVEQYKRNEVNISSGRQMLLSFLWFFDNVIAKCLPVVKKLEDQLTIHEALTEKKYLEPLFSLVNSLTTNVKVNKKHITYVIECLTHYAPKSELRFMIGKSPLDSTKKQSLIEIAELQDFHLLPEIIREQLIDIFSLRLDPITFKRSETLRRIKYFSSLFQVTNHALEPDDRDKISTSGLDAFQCPNFTNRFEHAFYNCYTTSGELKGEFSNGLLPLRYLISAHFKDHDFPIYDFKTSKTLKFIFADLNALPIDFAIKAKEIAIEIANSLEKQKCPERTISTNVYAFLNFVKNYVAKSNTISKAIMSGVNLHCILTQKKWATPLFKEIADSFTDVKKANNTILLFKRALHEYAPDIFPIKIIGHSIDQLKEIMKNEYPVLNDQLDLFISYFDSPITEHKTTRVNQFCNFLLAHINQFDTEFQLDIKRIGIKAFIANEGAAWLQFRNIERVTNKNKKIASSQCVIGWILTKMLGCQMSIGKYDPYLLEVESTTNDGMPAYKSVKTLKNYPIIIEELHEIANVETNRIDGEKSANTTTSSYVSGLIKVFTDHLPKLTEQEQQLVASSGSKAFIAKNSAIIKKIRQTIQSQVISKKISPQSGVTKQSCFDQYLKSFGIPLVPSYPVVTGKRSKHVAKEAEKQPIYTLKEAIELAYNIEFLLLYGDLTYHHKLCLNIARIVLKTTWNVTPLLKLETTDIFTINSPMGKTPVPCVRLFKKRAGYETQWHKLNLSVKDLENEGVVIGAEARSVFLNLKDIRDTLTAEQRIKMPENHPLKHRLFTTYSDEKMDWIAMGGNVFTTVNEVLEKNGCSVRFVARRVRKTGLNHIYKKLKKHFKQYQKTGKHSLDVFMKHYLEKNSTENRANLSNALTVMGDYFNGRKLTDDIIILTDIPEGSRQAPNGSCVSPGQDEASNSFNKQHHRLFKESNTDETPCADFNACLFCEHYRLIADAEHVWRLLSYRDFVLAQMRNSIGVFDDSSQQQIFAQTLELRVEQILKKIKGINPVALNEGSSHLKKYGVHQDWEIVA
jgi:hypothetical protein